jgi:hypothetical protein
MPDDYVERRDGRIPVMGTLRLMVKSGGTFLLASGEIVDLSAGGCAVRVGHGQVEANLKGRIDVAIRGKSLSLPIVTRWVRTEDDGLVVGCRFFELNVTEQRAIHDLILETCEIVIESSRQGRSLG